MADAERMVERLIEAVGELTKQVSRVAYATEAVRLRHAPDLQVKTCRSCLSRIQRHDAKQCGSCGEFMGDG